MATLGYSVIRNWLMSLGMLEETLDGVGQTVRHPTPQGESVGIALEQRTGKNGTYFVVVYNPAAQHFILDNLDSIIAFNRAKKENQGQPWSSEHDRFLLDLHHMGVPVNEIAVTLKQTPAPSVPD